MNRFLKVALALAFAMSLAYTSFAQTITPQGRLTLTTGTPVMYTNVTAAGTVYYTPYVGNNLPSPNGSGGYSNVSFSELTLTLPNLTYYPAGDIFVFYSASSWKICTAPWSSSTSRGTGASTTELTQIGGILVNQYALSCYNSSTNYNVNAQYAVYVGSFVPNGGALDFTPQEPASVTGYSSHIGLWNAYNRVPIKAIALNSNGSWSNSSSAWAAANGNGGGWSVTWIDGYAESAVQASYDVIGVNSLSNGYADVGIGLDGSTSPSGMTGQVQGASTIGAHAVFTSLPLLGVSYVFPLERVGYGTETFYSGGPLSQLTVDIDY